MRGDMVVALPQATAQGQTLFGYNFHDTHPNVVRPVLEPGRTFPPGETTQTSARTLPQVRQTFRVLGCRSAGMWGYAVGVNERGVAVGNTPVGTLWQAEGPALTGPDLVRLALERADSTRRAVDVLTEQIGRHGQGQDGEGNAFLVADGREAFVLEACGRHWAVQAVGRVRAVSDFCHLNQDWDRIARGLADEAIARGRWPGDGSKLNFSQAVGRVEGRDAGLPRWGRATILLEQHNGEADVPFFRRLLSDHGPSTRRAALCRHCHPEGTVNQGPRKANEDFPPPWSTGPATQASVIAELPGSAEELSLVWVAQAPPCQSVYLPLVLAGELPRFVEREEFGAHAPIFGRLQDRLDSDSREFLAEAKHLAGTNSRAELHALAGSFMQHAVERFEDVCATSRGSEVIPPISWSVDRGS